VTKTYTIILPSSRGIILRHDSYCRSAFIGIFAQIWRTEYCISNL